MAVAMVNLHRIWLQCSVPAWSRLRTAPLLYCCDQDLQLTTYRGMGPVSLIFLDNLLREKLSAYWEWRDGESSVHPLYVDINEDDVRLWSAVLSGDAGPTLVLGVQVKVGICKLRCYIYRVVKGSSAE